MRALRRIREDDFSLENPFEDLLAQFSATTLELNPSLGTAEFARRLTARAVEIFGARAAVLALGTKKEWEIAALSGSARYWNQLVQERLARILHEQAALSAEDPRSAACERLLGQGLAETLGWGELVLARLMGREGELVGILGLADLNRDLSSVESQLLKALASHASVALENVRLFSRIEQSRKHWVEDFDAITDFIVVHDSSNRVIRLNRALADMLGVRLTDVIGWDVGRLKLLASAQPNGQCPLCRSSEPIQKEFTHQTIEHTYLVSTSRVDASEETESRTIHVLKDITDRRDAERRYRRERDYNKNILNNTQNMILVLDTAGLISYVNRRCSHAGYSEENLIGRRLADIVPLAHRPMFSEALDKTLEGTAIENLEIPLLRGNGSAGQFSISLSPMRDEQAEINSVVVVMTDITQAANLQAKLMHTEKMAALGQLVSGVAHEVNNPLAAIVGFTDLLLENPDVPESAKDELHVILQEAQRTRVIVQNLLSFAREMPDQREPVQINSVLRQTLKLRTYDLANRSIELSERFDKDLPIVIGDPNQLQQVFLNIVNNAYDAIQEGQKPGKIRISTMHDREQLEISFWNNGPSISHPDRIFDPFFTTKEVGKGTGLGLSICYGIIRAHGGEIVAQNDPDGNGCTFFVRLPIAAVKSPELRVSKVAE